PLPSIPTHCEEKVMTSQPAAPLSVHTGPSAVMLAPALCERCRTETQRFRRGEPSDDGYCLEVVRRAVQQRDELCWSALTAIYHELVTSWCRRCGGTEAELDQLVASAWVKFWHGYTAAKLAAGGSLGAALTYLKTCARSAVLDQGRRQARLQAHEERAPSEDDVHGAGAQTEPDLAHLDRDAFWELVAVHLHDERERRLVSLTYEIGLRPAPVRHLYPRPV